MKTINTKVNEAITSKRASAELPERSDNYLQCPKKGAEYKVVLKSDYNGKLRQKTFYFKKK